MKKISLLKHILAAILAGSMTITSTAFAGTGGVTGEITVSCYDSMAYKGFLEYAAKSFVAEHPGTKVNIETFSTMLARKTATLNGSIFTEYEDNNEPNAKNDYIARVNIEMISGGGADIYAIDVLPYYKYADSGMFEDLRRFMDSDPFFVYENYRKNIFDAAMYADGQYILPLDYNFQCLVRNTTLMDPEVGEFEFGRYTYELLMELGYDSFISRYDPNAENQIRLFNLYTGNHGHSLYTELLNVNYNSFVDLKNKKANFTDGRFTQLLNRVIEYEEKGYIDAGPNFVSYLYKTTSSISLLNALNIDNMPTDLINIFSSSYEISRDDEPIGLLAGDNGESAFMTTQAYAMSTNSNNKEAAWAFLRFLIGDEMQSSTSLRYIPVNKNAATQKAKFELYGQYQAAGVWQGEAFNVVPAVAEGSEGTGYVDGEVIFSLFGGGDIKFNKTQQEVYETYMDYIDRYTALINTYTIRDVIIDEMIETEVKKFFDGRRTADEVAEFLQNKVSMYLQE